MSRRYTYATLALLMSALTACSSVDTVRDATQPEMQPLASTRSVLYPASWLPLDAGGGKTADGRFLHDFSYAGYKRGNEAIPSNPGRQTLSVSSSFADGVADATAEIQGKIDSVCANGGGVVNLPAGTYRIKPQPSGTSTGTKGFSLNLWCPRVVLRGATDASGMPITRLFNDATFMRGKRVILVGPPSPSGNWASPENELNPVRISSDLPQPTRVIPVESVSGLAVGDWVIIKSDMTEAFKADHGMQSFWPNRQGLLYRRQIKAIDTANRRLTIDVPTRYPLKTRDGARVAKLKGSNVYFSGVENLLIGMRENTTPGQGHNDSQTPGTGAYEMHDATAVFFYWAEVSWAKNIHSYRPAVNSRDVHLLSSGIRTGPASQGITVENCHLAKPQYRGGGGNGYLLYIQGQEGLWRGNTASRGRHNLTFLGIHASGNVVLGGKLEHGHALNSYGESSSPSDYHDTLSHANLIDGVTLEKELLLTTNRQSYSNGAGHTSSQNVYWNITGNAYADGRSHLIQSAQFDWGYIIGTQGAASAVSAPASGSTYDGTANGTAVNGQGDHVEMVGGGTNLLPISLYQDQLFERKNGRSPER